MSKLSTQPYRGTRDFIPEDMFLQNHIYAVWRDVCTSFGYQEYMTPTVESIDLYTAKTSEEIVSKQTYSFTDRGDRKVTIRPEMTPSVSRMVAGNRNEFTYPLRLFSIPNCMRYERPQKGRLREFWQLNADIFGVEGIDADIEVITLADSIMKAFGATDDMYEIRVNSRKLLNKIISEYKPKSDVASVIRVVDSFDKLTTEEAHTQLKEVIEGDPAELYCALTESEHNELSEFVELCADRGVTVVADTGLARGFDYYNDIVFEVFDTNPDNNRSMFGGGRYDSLVGQFGGGDVASVGFGMGDATLAEFLNGHGLAPEYTSYTDVWLGVIGDNQLAAHGVAQELRSCNVNVAIDYSGRKAEKQIKSALKAHVPFVLFIGENELENNTFTLKELATKEEHTGTIEEISRLIVDFNNK